jgi:type IV pilus assembly protein PilB
MLKEEKGGYGNMETGADKTRIPEMRGKRERLGDLLVKRGVISPENLKTALSYQRNTKEKLGLILLEMGVTSETALAEALGMQFDLPFVMVSQEEVEPQALNIIPREVALKHQILPMRVQGNELTVAISDPSNVFLLDELRMLTKMRIHAVISFNTDITRALYRYYGVPLEAPTSVDEILSQMDEGEVEVIQRYAEYPQEEATHTDLHGGDAPIIKLVNAIIFEAIRARASDIHIEPFDPSVPLRYRIDGVLQQRPDLPRSHQNAIISRIKILSGMDIAEKRLPQDGRFRVRSGGNSVDLRVNTVPTPSGEKMVLRLLDQSNLMVNLESLGFLPDDQERFLREIHKPWGMCLVTGPTGSGKSTTLYSALATLNTPGKNISTVEDPVEYRLPGIIQVAANDNIGCRSLRPCGLFCVRIRHHHGGGDSRSGNRPGRRESRANGAHGFQHPAHQRCRQRHQPLDQHGRRAVPDQWVVEHGRGSAARPPHLPFLQRGL